MDTDARRYVLGENGRAAYRTTRWSLLDLFNRLVRDLPPHELDALMAAALAEVGGAAARKKDLVVLLFSTRDARGGKGERRLFLDMLFKIVDAYGHSLFVKLLPLVPHYGYWKDVVMICEMAIAKGKDEMAAACVTMFKEQLLCDRHSASPSLAAKYAPREGSHNRSTFSRLAAVMGGKAAYRQLTASLNKTTTEVLMSGRRFRNIRFKSVPSKCLTQHRKAFLNEKLKQPPSEDEKWSGNRFPDNEDRVKARQNLLALLGSKTERVKGGQLAPHELVGKLSESSSSADLSVLNAQWASLRDDVVRRVAEGGWRLNPSRLVALVDVSGSMAWKDSKKSVMPMDVAIALGILISEIAHPAWQDRVLTFETSPRWVELKGTLSDKVATLKHAPWGGATDFDRAYRVILRAAEANKLTQEQMPESLIVFSDMQFNIASCSSDTAFTTMREAFTEAGYKMPRMIFWNLRGAVAGFPVERDEGETIMLSGFSPSLMKTFLGGPIPPTPEEALRKLLDDARYDPVRAALAVAETPVADKEERSLPEEDFGLYDLD